MELYNEGNGWDAMHDDLLFTSGMLLASGTHAPLARPLEAHLAKWDALDVDGTQADRDVVKANARVAWVNLDLDGRTTRYGAQLLVDCGGNRGSATFKRFFPVPPNEITRLGLDSQLKAMEKFPTLADEIDLPKASAAAVKQVIAVFEPGREAVAARTEANLGTTRASVKQAAWRDEANALRRAVETALDDYANKQNLPRGYSAGFFPSQKKGPAKAAPTEADLVLALPDHVLRLLPESYVTTLPADAQAAVRTRLGR
jgi:hypothetical protein